MWAPPVKAASPAVVQTNAGYAAGGGGSCYQVAASCVLPAWGSSITKGDWIVLDVYVAFPSGNCGTHTTTITDSQSNSWTQDGYYCPGGVFNPENSVQIWHTVASATGADTITIGVSSTTNPGGGVAGFGYEVSGVSAIGGTATGSCGSGCGQLASTSTLTYPIPSFTNAIIFSGSLSSATYENGYSSLCAQNLCNEGVAGMYSTTSPLPGGDTFTVAKGQTVIWSELAIYYYFNGSGAAGAQNIGSCPTKNTATVTLTNNTIFMYEGLSVGVAQSVNSMSTFVASTTGSGSHTLRLLIYAQQVVGFTGASISVGFPLIKQAEYSYTLTAGTKNSAVSQALALTVGAQGISDYWAVAVVGDDHIKINASSLSGLYTQTGNPSTNAQPNSFTSAGSASGSQVYLCAGSTYASIVVITMISTQFATTTAVSTTTVASATLNPTVNLSNLMLGVIVLLGPALLIAGVTKTLWGGILGAVLGLCIGVVAGFLPIWTVAVVLIVCMVALFFGNKSNGGGL